MSSAKPKPAVTRAKNYAKQSKRDDKWNDRTPKQQKRLTKKSNQAAKRSTKWHEWL